MQCETYCYREIEGEQLQKIEVEHPKKDRDHKIHVDNVPKRREFPEFNLDKDFGRLKLNDFGFRHEEDDFFKRFNHFGNANNLGNAVMRNPGGRLDVNIDGRVRRHSDIDMIPAGRNVHDIQAFIDQHDTYDG